MDGGAEREQGAGASPSRRRCRCPPTPPPCPSVASAAVVALLRRGRRASGRAFVPLSGDPSGSRPGSSRSRSAPAWAELVPSAPPPSSSPSEPPGSGGSEERRPPSPPAPVRGCLRVGAPRPVPVPSCCRARGAPRAGGGVAGPVRPPPSPPPPRRRGEGGGGRVVRRRRRCWGRWPVSRGACPCRVVRAARGEERGASCGARRRCARPRGRVGRRRVFFLRSRPQVRRGDPLNLSILVSGGKETNEDSLSNGE